MKHHAGDCTIYSALINGSPTDGICTCGYGWNYVRESGGDWKHMYSEERRESIDKQETFLGTFIIDENGPEQFGPFRGRWEYVKIEEHIKNEPTRTTQT